MNYEQKYKEAKSLMEDCIPNEDGYVTIKPSDIFPELAESEDERIRKWLIGYFHQYKEDGIEKYANGLKVDSIIAWLEKKGEQKSIINVPPRNVILAIWDLGNEWKELTNGSISTEYGTQLDYIQKHWHESEYYLKEKKELREIEEEYNGEDYGIDGLWHAITILERTLGEVEGYQTDDGILEHKCAIKAVRDLVKERKKQKSIEWSYKDEKMIDYFICFIEHLYEVAPCRYENPDIAKRVESNCLKRIEWLKSLKQRMEE